MKQRVVRNNMAKTQLDKDFWRDEFIHSQSVEGKFLYTYLLTCPASNIAGVYQIPIFEIAAHTGLSEKQIKHLFEEWGSQGKILYRDGWVCVKNRIKYNTDSESIVEGVEKILLKSPDFIKEFISYTPANTSPPPISNDIRLDRIELDKDKDSSCSYVKIKEKWNLFVRSYNATNQIKLAEIEIIGSDRQKHIKARKNEGGFDIDRVIEEIKQSDWLQGKKSQGEHAGWKVSFDFVIGNKYSKIIEGGYRNKQQPERKTYGGIRIGKPADGGDKV